VRILGIDPGYGILGWSVIENDLKIVQYGTIETAAHKRIDDRLLEIHEGISYIISTYSPDCAAIEKLYFAKNTTTALDVAKTIGVILLALKKANLDYAEYSPSQVKQSITTYGRASKQQMQTMIKTIFNLKEIPRPDDAADALAIAACHSFRI